MKLPPLIASLQRHKLTVLLLILQVAITCGVLSNAVFMIAQRIESMRVSTGILEDEVVFLRVSNLGDISDRHARLEEDLASIRSIPGVEKAAVVNTLPLSHDSWSFGVTTSPGDAAVAEPAAYFGSAGEVEALGLEWAAGTDFAPTDYHPLQVEEGFKGVSAAPTVIVTQALAQRIFPNQDALGKTIYLTVGSPHPIRIVGIVKRLVRPELNPAADRELSLLLPIVPDLSEVTYLIRAKPDQQARVLKQAADSLYSLYGKRLILASENFSQSRESYFHHDVSIATLLAVTCAALMLVTTLGIFGLASFWVQQRRRQIGIRRALGASRVDILRYFQLENFLIVSGGVGLGWLLAYLINSLLMHYYELAVLSFACLPVSGLLLWLLGQLAVLRPAVRASSIPPSAVTRSD
jgi:putative ABC transport system permease protein